MYLWQEPGWPALTWDASAVTAPLAQARLAQGRMLGLAGGLGVMDLAELQLAGWTQEALATAQIEGEQLQLNSVRASAARRLGLANAPATPRDARTEATLDVLQAAVTRWEGPLAEQDLFDWHAALFPAGRSGVTGITHRRLVHRRGADADRQAAPRKTGRRALRSAAVGQGARADGCPARMVQRAQPRARDRRPVDGVGIGG